MCRELGAIRQSIISYAADFDVRCFTPAQAGEVVRLCAQIEASAASVKALAAARSAEGRGWQDGGYRSAADQLAHDAGMSPAAAQRALEAGRRMAVQPGVASAALAGELSAEQAAAVSQGVAADPARAVELIAKAKRLSLPELHEEIARVKAARTDQEQRRRAVHARRSFRRWTDLDGAMQAHIYGHLEDGAILWRMLDPIRRRLNVLRRQPDTANETLDALDYDAVITLASIATGRDSELALTDLVDIGLFPQLDSSVFGDGGEEGAPAVDSQRAAPAPPPDRTQGRRRRRPTTTKLAGSPLRLMVRVDLDSLLRGVCADGELCEIAGYGPVPVSVVEDLLATENPFIVGILTRGQAVSGVYHHGRRPNSHQRSALDFLQPSCAVEGCSSRAALQYDHRLDFAKARFTAFDLLDRLCPHHHRLKTNRGWALVDGRGKRAFVAPGDLRHPRFARPGDLARPPPHSPGRDRVSA